MEKTFADISVGDTVYTNAVYYGGSEELIPLTINGISKNDSYFSLSFKSIDEKFGHISGNGTIHNKYFDKSVSISFSTHNKIEAIKQMRNNYFAYLFEKYNKIFREKYKKHL